MEWKVSELVKSGHDQVAELKSSCGAVDVRDVAQLISDLATQLDVQLARSNALASLEAEPVGFIARHKETGKFGSYLHPKADWFKNGEYEVLNAYTAPPAPVSVPEGVASTIESLKQTLVDCNRYNYCFDAVKRVEDACRAAMLQGAVQPQNQQQNIPENIPANTPCKLRAAVETIRNSGIEIDAEKIFAERDALNSPVIPDAYDIEAFGIFSATEGENGLMLQIERFRFGTEKCPQIGKENMVPKFALQGVINRLQEHCDSMGNEALVDILSTPVAPQQETK
ncbi:hypothetical protein ECV0102_07730 [Enterobacter cloacae]|nr:hypothetical protein ECV0102_07730 [Enterobacter cloacae]